MIEQIRKLKDASHPTKKICVILGVSRNTVRRYLRTYLDSQKNETIQNSNKTLPWMDIIDWPLICERRRKGFTAKQLYQEFEPKISYSTFCTRLRESLGNTTEISIRLQHKPGEKCQVDFCDVIFITDHKTGKDRKENKNPFVCRDTAFFKLLFWNICPKSKTRNFHTCTRKQRDPEQIFLRGGYDV